MSRAIQFLRGEWEFQCYCSAVDGSGKLSTIRFFILNLMTIARCELLNRFICSKKGHDLYDSGSYANPDHGADDYTCSRCKQNWHHTYY